MQLLNYIFIQYEFNLIFKIIFIIILIKLKMKFYEFKKKSLDDIPTINDDEKFELKLENNNISNFNTEKISINCRKLHLQNNK